jgi:hypothetical protein
MVLGIKLKSIKLDWCGVRVGGWFWHPSGVRFVLDMFSGGLRVAATSGYYLATFQVATAAIRADGQSPKPEGWQMVA